MTHYTLANADIVSGIGIRKKSSVTVSGETLADTGQGPKIDLKGESYVYPALINVHDHMRGNYVPRVGPPKRTLLPQLVVLGR